MPSITPLESPEPKSINSSDPLDALLNSYNSTHASSSGSGGAGGIGPEKKKEYGYKDFEAILESTPLFMKETPKEGETSDVLEALRTLVFEGEGDEVATNFKNHGNELYLQKSYSDAIQAYTEGLDAHPQENTLRVSLLNNRAQCHLSLKNHRSVLKDTGTIIALYTAEKLKTDKALIKAMWRATQSLFALERFKESLDVIQRAKVELKENEIKGEDLAAWDGIEDKVNKGIKREKERIIRIKKENLIKISLEKAIKQRGLIVIKTNNPPDNPNQLHFDPEYLDEQQSQQDEQDGPQAPSIETPLIFPVFLLYPQYTQSDFITHFQENTSFQDHLLVMFPKSPSKVEIPYAEWDINKEYYVDNLVIYVETKYKRLLKVGKELTLREIIQKANKTTIKGNEKETDGIVLKDGLMSFVVLPKGEKEKKWIEEFKKSRDGK